MKKIVLALIVTCFVAISCKTEGKKAEKEVAKTEGVQETSFKIAGMTCEIGCAKAIASKLSKKEGVVEANVVFKDSIATVKYDASKTSKKDIMAFVDGIGGEGMYKSCPVDCTKTKAECAEKAKKECDKTKKEECKKTKTECAEKNKKECDSVKKATCTSKKTACKETCTKPCCA